MKTLLWAWPVLLGSALSAGVPAGAAEGEESSSSKDPTAKTIESKIAIETNLERRLQSVLAQVIGPGRAVVIINVELLNVEQRTVKEKPKSEQLALPGVPKKEDPTANPLWASLTMVKRLSATLLIDQGVPSEQVETAKKMLTELLGISPARGDTLVVQKASFFKEGKYPFLTPDFWRMVWITLAAVGVFIFLRYFLQPLVQTGRDYVEVLRTQGVPSGGGKEGGRDAGEDEEPEAAPTLAAGAPAAGAQPPINGSSGKGAEAGLFAFVHAGNLPNLIHLLKKSPPGAVAVAVHYLPPALGSRILASLPHNTLAEVTGILSNVTEMDPKAVKQFEDQVRAKIEYLVGGEERLLDLLGDLSPEVQQAALGQLEAKNKSLAERLKKRIVSLDDLGGLEGPGVRAVLRRAGFPVFCQVLKAQPSVAEAVRAKLPPAMVERVNNEIAMAPPVPAQVLEENRRRVLGAMKDLVREGWIELKKG